MPTKLEDEAKEVNDPESVEIEELTEWENPPKLQDLKNDMDDAKSDKDAHVTQVDTWLENLNVTGAAKHKKRKGRSEIVPKTIRKHAEWRYASLSEPFLSTDDVFNAEPVTYEDKLSAEQNNLVLNNQFNTKIEKIKFFDEYVRTAVDEGTVVVKIGWAFEEEEQDRLDAQFDFVDAQGDEETVQLHAELHEMMEKDPDRYEATVPEELKMAHDMSMKHEIPFRPIKISEETITELVTTKNQPTLEVCDYRNITIDPSCLGDLSKANFIIHSFETSLSDLEKDGKYKNLGAINVSTNSVLGDPDHYTDDNLSFSFSDKPRSKLVAHEYWGYWDIDGTGIVKPIIATYVGEVLIRMEENPFPDKELPFVLVQYLPVRRGIYGEPDGALLEDNQKIIGAVTRGMIDSMARSANGQMAIRKGALDITNKRKFDRGEDYEINASNGTADSAFFMHTYPELPQSAQLMLAMQNSEAESLTGVKAFNSGISGEALGDSATGIKSALDATSKRELGILRRLAEGVKQIGRKFISMNSEFLEEEEVVRITNDDFVLVRKDDLAGNMDLTLNISTAEADEHKAQELAFMLQTMGNTVDMGLSQIVLSDIARLRKMPSLAKQIKDFVPQPDPMEEKMKELQIALLEAQIDKEISMAEENRAEAQLDMAKAQAELAGIGKTQSETDKNNLDYVEQETGTTQARELEKSSEQAKGNMALKILESKLAPKEGKN